MKKSILVLLLFALSTLCAQAQITGSGCALAPMKTPEGERMHCFVLHPLTGTFSIRIEAPAGSKLKKYAKAAADAVEVTRATHDGSTFVLANPDTDCGYVVEKPSGLPDYYWLARYESAPLPQGTLTAEYDPNAPCERLLLRADTPFASWQCYTPQGNVRTLERLFRIVYTDLTYDEAAHRFVPKQTEASLPLRNEGLELFAPLADTHFTLLGDQFTALLGINQPALESNLLPARRIELHALYEIENNSADSVANAPKSAYGAPLKITMKAIANEPAAARFTWRIVSAQHTSAEAPLLFSAEGAETSYTFTQMGSYLISVEALSRDGQCTATDADYKIDIAASRLEVPNAFTPFSSPGVNDRFRVAHRSLTQFKGYIYNAWGKLLFSWDNPDEGWDGTFNGKPVPTGAYYYVITAKGADGVDYNLKGHLNILATEWDAGTGEPLPTDNLPTPIP